MKTRTLGDGLTVPVQGLGAMGMSAFYGRTDEDEAVATIREALDKGVTLLDTAEAYGPFRNEQLIGRALGARRSEAIIATKFATEFDDEGRPRGLNGSPAYARRAAERSLRHLGTDVIDLYYLHRVDPAIPIEETVGGMAELVADGLVRHIGLSEVSSETIRRAQAVHPLAAVQSELSLFSPDVLDNGVLETLRELEIGLVAFSPLGRGFLTGSITSVDDLAEDDARRSLPRFQPDSIAANLRLVEKVRDIAQRLDASPGQIAIAWVQAVGAVPIPGTRHRRRLAENAAAADLELPADVLDEINSAVARAGVAGARDTEAGLARMHA